MTEQQLMSYFKFNAADLAANEKGLFTDSQRARLIHEDKSSRTWAFVLGGVLMGVGLIGLIGALVAIRANPDPGFAIGFGIGFGCVWPVIWGGLGYAALRSALSRHQMKLARVQGAVNIVRSESYSSHTHTTSVYHELHIGGEEFSVDEDLADVLMQGQEYILYYVDGTDEILSAEPVGK